MSPGFKVIHKQNNLLSLFGVESRLQNHKPVLEFQKFVQRLKFKKIENAKNFKVCLIFRTQYFISWNFIYPFKTNKEFRSKNTSDSSPRSSMILGPGIFSRRRGLKQFFRCKLTFAGERIRIANQAVSKRKSKGWGDVSDLSQSRKNELFPLAD